MIVLKENGTVYSTMSDEVATHAEIYGFTLSKVERPLTYIDGEYVDDITEEEIGEGVRVLRDLKFDETSFLVERHREELELGLDTTLSPLEHQEVLQYRQQLRDLPLQEGFPLNIVWPVYSGKV